MSIVVPEIDPAVILFAEFPDPARPDGPLAADLGAARAAAVQRALIERQFAVLAELEGVTPYIFFDPPEQEEAFEDWLRPYGEEFALAAQSEGDFLERMAAAFRRIFSRNVTVKALIFRPEFPRLDSEVIREALSLLDSTDLVVGPSSAGGLYLLGMRRFIPQAFEGLAAGDAKLGARIIENIQVVKANGTLLSSLEPVCNADSLARVFPEWMG